MSAVYTADGRAVRVITNMPDGRKVVELAVEDGDDDELYFTGQTEIVGRVFDNPPVEAQHKEIAHLEATVNRLRDKLSTLQGEVSKAEHAHKERIAKFKRYEQLQRIEDFLDGKLTHYVIVDKYNGCSVRISTPQDEKSGDDHRSWKHELKLLVLYGNQKDYTVDWLLNYYSDGSGSRDDKVYPFTCYEDAKAKAETLIGAAFEFVRGNPDWYRSRQAITSATSIGMEVPVDVLAICREHEAKAARENVEKVRKELANAEKVLAAVQGGAA